MKITKPKLLSEAEKKLKKISDIFRDKSVVGFKVSVKLYHDDLESPKIISIDGERSIDGSWNTRSSKERNPDTLHSREVVKARLASIEEHVSAYMLENGLEVDWRELERSIDDALKSGLSVEDLEYRYAPPINALAASSYEAHFCAPLMATVYVKEGAKALTENCLDHALYCVNRGLHWSSPAMFLPDPNGRFKARASTGGRGKDLRREPAKDKVAELLIELAPEEGWKSRPTAIEEVANNLIANHASFIEKCFLKSDALPRKIREWIQKDPKRFAYRIKSKP